MTLVRRLFVLLCGFEIIPKTVSTRNRGEGFILSEPVCSYLLDTELGWVLLDAGINPANLDDPAKMAARFSRFIPPVVRPAHRLDAQLAEIGIDFADIGHVIISHLHFDHCGYLNRFPHARISIQRSEYQWAFSNDAEPAYFRDDYDDPRLRWELKDGDWQAMPGLELLDTRGHSRGHQSAMIKLPDTGTVLLPFDAGDLDENFAEEILPGCCYDDVAAMNSIRRINELRVVENAAMFLFHDPVAVQRMRLAPLFYS